MVFCVKRCSSAFHVTAGSQSPSDSETQQDHTVSAPLQSDCESADSAADVTLGWSATKQQQVAILTVHFADDLLLLIIAEKLGDGGFELRADDLHVGQTLAPNSLTSSSGRHPADGDCTSLSNP